MLDTLETAQIQLQETVYSLRHYQQGLAVDPQRLTEVNERLDAIHTVARKYRATPEQLPALLDKSRQRLEELATSLDAGALQQREAEAKEACLKIAAELSATRSKAAQKLSRKVSDAMQKLAMQGGAFKVVLTANDECASYGLEQVEFQVAGHAGSPLRPLSKAASGGELSRIALAIETVTTEVAQVPTLIFDEVDAGIGGNTAAVVGEMLKGMGKHNQIITITHQAPVAKIADNHVRAEKEHKKDKTITRLVHLDDDSRKEEIQRMIGI